MSPRQQEEERVLIDAAICSEQRSYAVSMAAVVRSLTSAEPATAEEIAEVKAAEAASHEAIAALEYFRRQH